MRAVPATEFTRNFGQYREIVQREPVAVTSHGRATGYLVSAVEFEDTFGTMSIGPVGKRASKTAPALSFLRP